MSNISHIIHKNSSERNTGNNGPKIPDANDIEYGEIAINYDKGNETLLIKNSNNEIIEIVNKNNIINALPYNFKLNLLNILKTFTLVEGNQERFRRNYNSLIEKFNLIEKDKKTYYIR